MLLVSNHQFARQRSRIDTAGDLAADRALELGSRGSRNARHQSSALYQKKLAEQNALVQLNTEMATQLDKINSLRTQAEVHRINGSFDDLRQAIKLEAEANTACGRFGSPVQIDSQIQANNARRKALQDWIDDHR